ncbi:unnamed protein product, partial [Meganyctiphanes norvegica]
AVQTDSNIPNTIVFVIKFKINIYNHFCCLCSGVFTNNLTIIIEKTLKNFVTLFAMLWYILTWVSLTGSQEALFVAWPLNGPSNVSIISWKVKAQTADSSVEFSCVLKMP